MSSRNLKTIFLVIALFLAGCIGGDDGNESGTENSEGITFNHQFELIEVSGVTGPYSDSNCGYEEEMECHIFVISFSNIGADDLYISPPYWSAIGNDGEIYTTYTGDGLSKISPNATTEITLGFDVNNSIKLTTLRFNAQTLDSNYEWLLDSTEIPSYDVVQSEEEATEEEEV